jgi:hypothetical protein
VTTLLWPSSICIHLPLLASQTLTVLPPNPQASRFELCEKATERAELWHSSVWRHALLLASQILTVQSTDAEARRAEKDTELTKSTMALKRLEALYAARIPDLNCPSSGAEASRVEL